MLLDPSGEPLDFRIELRQRRGITHRQFTDAACKNLRNAVKLALHGGRQSRHPLVVNHQRLDLGRCKLGVFIVGELVEPSLLLLYGALERGFALCELQPTLQHHSLVLRFLVALDLLESRADLGLRDLVERYL
jgi:hypothetical protein